MADPPEAGAAAQQLALGAFTAIHQKTMTSCFDQEAGLVPLHGRNTGRGAKECQTEHHRATLSWAERQYETTGGDSVKTSNGLPPPSSRTKTATCGVQAGGMFARLAPITPD
jgi:hypothetical protein